MNKDIFTQYSSAGGEKTFSCAGKELVDLLNLAVAASSSGGRIILYDLSDLDRPEIERIAHAGKGNILFDLR